MEYLSQKTKQNQQIQAIFLLPAKGQSMLTKQAQLSPWQLMEYLRGC